MSEQLTNNRPYADRLSALRKAMMAAIETAHPSYVYGTPEESTEVAYVNLWDALLNALITHADCDHAELLGIVAGTLQMRIPIVGTVEPSGAVRFDEGWIGRLTSGAGGLL